MRKNSLKGPRSLAGLVVKRLTIWLLFTGSALIILAATMWVADKKKAIESEQRHLVKMLAQSTDSFLQDAGTAMKIVTGLRNWEQSEQNIPYLKSIQQAYPYFDRLVVLDQGGRVVVSVPDGPTNISYVSKIGVKSSNSPFFDRISSVYVAQGADHPTVNLYKALPGGWDLVAELNLYFLKEPLVPAGRHSDIQFFVSDSYGNVLAHSDWQKVLEQTNLGGWPLFNVPTKQNGAISSLYSMDGVWFFGSIARVQQSDWVVGVSTPVSVELGPIVFSVALFCSFFISLWIIMTVFLRRVLEHRVVKPLSRFAAAMGDVAGGQYPKDIIKGERTFEELETMAGAFSSMAEAIRQRETALVASEERFRRLAENARDMIFRMRLIDGVFEYVSPASTEMTGYSPEDHYAEPFLCRRILHPDSEKAFAEHWSKLLKGQTDPGAEFAIIHRTGGLRWLSIRMTIIQDSAGQPVAIEAIATDVTARKKADQDKEALQSHALQAQKMEALGTLTGGIAHDFNNLLQIMAGNVQLLLYKRNPADQDYSLIQKVEEALGRATRLVRRLLLYSRKAGAEQRPTDLNEIVEASLEILRPAIPRMIVMETAFDPKVKLIQADPVQIEQVLLNLVANARDAMEGSGIIRITTHHVSREESSSRPELPKGEYVLLTVSDTGPGMDEGVLAHIYEPFYTTKEVGKGTGLGLSIVYGVVRGHDGYVFCQSRRHIGTTFDIYLPVIENSSAVDGKGEFEISVAPSGRETILLVDDEPDLLEVSHLALTQFGYQTLRAESGEQALAAFWEQGASIGAVLLDLDMPGMGGKACLEALLGFNPKVKIIVATGHASPTLADELSALGAAAFLRKPFSLDMLLRTIRSVLDQKPSSSESPASLD